MSDHFKEIYGGQAAAYQAMIAAEDSRGELQSTIRGLLQRFDRPLVVDVGSGTGRFGQIAGDLAGHLVAVDLYDAMLREQQRVRSAAAHAAQWSLAQGDGRRLPLPDDRADVVLAGWSLGHMTGWYPSTWPQEIGVAVGELKRVCRPGGVICIAETMTTGGTVPAPPAPVLADYYRWLEDVHGFKRTILQTDFAFATAAEAAAMMGFFFGESLIEKINSNDWHVVPEWTGLWMK